MEWEGRRKRFDRLLRDPARVAAIAAAVAVAERPGEVAPNRQPGRWRWAGGCPPSISEIEVPTTTSVPAGSAPETMRVTSRVSGS